MADNADSQQSSEPSAGQLHDAVHRFLEAGDDSQVGETLTQCRSKEAVTLIRLTFF